MALSLSLSYAQANNGITLTLTDDSGTYNNPDNLTGWGDPNPVGGFVFADIVASTTTTADKYHLQLDITVTDKAGTVTQYDTIDLYDHNGGAFVNVNDFVFNINPTHLIDDSIAMGIATDRLTDGIYNIVYALVDAPTDLVTTASIEQNILLDGDVRADVYNKLRQVPVDYDNENNDKSKDIMEALLSYTYLQALGSSADTSQIEELYTQLYTLDKLVSDGSNYTW